MEAILLPGGLGYIGSNTTVQLYPFLNQLSNKTNKQYKIIIIDNLFNSRIEVIKRINQSLGTDNAFEFYQIDILDKTSLSKLFEEQVFFSSNFHFHQIAKNSPIKFVLHFAALKAVGESVQKPLLYFNNNVIGTINLLECMQQYNCFNIIFSSSATVYKPGEYVNEEVQFQPSNPYGETKITVEYMLRSLAKSSKQWRIMSLRYFNPVGATEDGLLGDSPSVFPNNLFPYIEQVAIGNRPELVIFGKNYPTPDGTGIRDYIHVFDLAEGHIAALDLLIQKHEENAPFYDYYNLGSGKGYSVYEIVIAYSKIIGKELPHRFGERREGDVAILTANPEKALKELKWQTKKNLEEMCRDSWNFIQKNPKGIC